MTYKERKERAAILRSHRLHAGRIGCEVWQRSGIGPKGDLAWHVTNTAIDAAVKYTYAIGIDDEQWTTAALAVYLDSISK